MHKQKRYPIRIIRMAAAWLLGSVLFLATGMPAQAQSGPEEAVVAHFDAIMAQEYTQADMYFSREFRAAFKADVDRMNAYYRTRAGQLARGYEIRDVSPLDDGDRETMRVTVDFADEDPDDGLEITERIFYYLVRQNSTDRDAVEGKAWRIDIFDALGFDSLADARRRPYLYSGQEWDEFASRELVARQGLFRIHMALESFGRENGGYPLRLLGSDSRRDELISSNKLGATYPNCGFDDRPMRSVQFEEKSSGDFSYYSVDTNGDNIYEGYWLLLHGRDESGFYYEGRDTIYILSSNSGWNQREQAEGFADFWAAREGSAPVLTDVTEFILPEIRFGGTLGAPPAPTMEQLTERIAGAEPVEAPAPEQGSLDRPRSTSGFYMGGIAVGAWVRSWANDRLEHFFGPDAPPDPLEGIKVEVPLEVHSFGSWD